MICHHLQSQQYSNCVKRQKDLKSSNNFSVDIHRHLHTQSQRLTTRISQQSGYQQYFKAQQQFSLLIHNS